VDTTIFSTHVNSRTIPLVGSISSSLVVNNRMEDEIW